MAITKETEIGAIEVVGEYNTIQVATDTVIKEDDTEISRSRHRHVLTPDMDISGEHAEVQAIANTAWTDAVKAKWTKYQEDNKDK